MAHTIAIVPEFDPYHQNFTLLAPDGVTPVRNYLSDVAQLQSIQAVQSIVYGVQIGMTGLLLVVLLLTTRPEKRRSIVFVLNSIALTLACVRSILSATVLTGPFYNYYNWALGYYPLGRSLESAQAVSVTAEITNVLLNATVFASLALQVRIVCCTLTTFWTRVVRYSSYAVALLACTIRVVLSGVNIKYSIIGINSYTIDQLKLISRVASANNIVAVISIAFFSIIFTLKLFFAILARRRLRLTQFGPMQIIFIMGCQTLIIPLIFAIITYYALPGHQLNSFVIPIVAVFLPLSGLWASAQQETTESRDPAQARFVRMEAGHPSPGEKGSLYSDRTLATLGNSETSKGLSPASKNSGFAGVVEIQPVSNGSRGDIAADEKHGGR